MRDGYHEQKFLEDLVFMPTLTQAVLSGDSSKILDIATANEHGIQPHRVAVRLYEGRQQANTEERQAWSMGLTTLFEDLSNLVLPDEELERLRALQDLYLRTELDELLG